MQLDDRAVAVDHYGFGRFGKRFSLVAAFHSARAIHRNGNFEGHRLRPGRGIARCRRTGARAGFGSCQRVRILDDKRHRAHTCEAEFAVCPLETRFPYRGYLFYLLLLRRKPTIVQAYHFWLSNNFSRALLPYGRKASAFGPTIYKDIRPLFLFLANCSIFLCPNDLWAGSPKV